MRKQKEKTVVEKAVEVLFEGGIDSTGILGQGGVLKEFTKAILERALKAEMDDHLGYKSYEHYLLGVGWRKYARPQTNRE